MKRTFPYLNIKPDKTRLDTLVWLKAFAIVIRQGRYFFSE